MSDQDKTEEGMLGDAMHIRKPKPLHGVRELLTEVGVIVIGILIALALEQSIEALHRHESVTAARKQIRDELAGNAWRLWEQEHSKGCVDARLDDIERILSEALSSGKIAKRLVVGRPWHHIWEAARWTSVTQAGVAAYLPEDDSAAYSNIYSLFANLTVDSVQEQQSWANLQSLRYVSEIDRPEALVYLREVDKIRLYRVEMHNLAGILQRAYKPLHLDLSGGPQKYDVKIQPPTVCTPFTGVA
ncbi:MAG TPA: hypothetical protein VG407_18420 [Caulobacteraceae bacterium]|jgi:hypothetical protein|nr:hypothetical protein [Caulobacteraceae bacterium]